MQKAGSGLGSGAVIVMDETTCMVRACQRIARFYYAESCGQCTPCREGTGWMYRVLTRIVEGNATMDDVEMLKQAAGQIEGHTICAFGEAAAWPVQGFLRHYWNEFEYFVANKRSIVDAPWRSPHERCRESIRSHPERGSILLACSSGFRLRLRQERA